MRHYETSNKTYADRLGVHPWRTIHASNCDTTGMVLASLRRTFDPNRVPADSDRMDLADGSDGAQVVCTAKRAKSTVRFVVAM
jgi:hypothetical protein